MTIRGGNVVGCCRVKCGGEGVGGGGRSVVECGGEGVGSGRYVIKCGGEGVWIQQKFQE